jgi:heat shock protein HslJ
MRSLLSILGIVLVVTGCSSGSPGSPGSPGVPGGIRLEGVTWNALTIAGLPPSADHVPSLAIAGPTISGSGGCNRYSGGARIEGGRLLVDGLAMTAMACLDVVANEREQTFVTILSSRPLISARDGRLVLTGAGGEIVLESPGIFAGPTD